MNGPLLAEFRDPDALLAASRQVRENGHSILDAFTPFPVEGIADTIDIAPSRIRGGMLVAGLGVAAFAYWLQWWSAVIDFPLNLGGRPLHSWPVFLLVPFEIGVLAAAVAGFVILLWRCGLPRLHHPVFGAVQFERASQDRFFLLTKEKPDSRDGRLRDLLHQTGALTVSEVGS
ncbi:DUF3341 domain-containing protein [Microvirga sp. 2MCAF38]|uniref:DUF3341 domain-containing protein n=1 Tax=Microvirga sp. 2MCAF38 TaxID=3232989 RepID=UPI003F9AB45B